MELGDLTIVAGRNNTGKTYLAYTLYGFLKMLQQTPYLVFERGIDSTPPPIDIGRLTNEAVEAGQARCVVDRKTLDGTRRALADTSCTASQQISCPRYLALGTPLSPMPPSISNSANGSRATPSQIASPWNLAASCRSNTTETKSS